MQPLGACQTNLHRDGDVIFHVNDLRDNFHIRIRNRYRFDFLGNWYVADQHVHDRHDQRGDESDSHRAYIDISGLHIHAYGGEMELPRIQLQLDGKAIDQLIADLRAVRKLKQGETFR